MAKENRGGGGPPVLPAPDPPGALPAPFPAFLYLRPKKLRPGFAPAPVLEVKCREGEGPNLCAPISNGSISCSPMRITC